MLFISPSKYPLVFLDLHLIFPKLFFKLQPESFLNANISMFSNLFINSSVQQMTVECVSQTLLQFLVDSGKCEQKTQTLGSWRIHFPGKIQTVLADLRDTEVLIPDHCSNGNTTLKWVIWLCLSLHITLYLHYTVVYCVKWCCLKKQSTYLNFKIMLLKINNAGGLNLTQGCHKPSFFFN